MTVYVFDTIEKKDFERNPSILFEDLSLRPLLLILIFTLEKTLVSNYKGIMGIACCKYDYVYVSL